MSLIFLVVEFTANTAGKSLRELTTLLSHLRFKEALTKHNLKVIIMVVRVDNTALSSSQVQGGTD